VRDPPSREEHARVDQSAFGTQIQLLAVESRRTEAFTDKRGCKGPRFRSHPV
jgi:hypothetical protein